MIFEKNKKVEILGQKTGYLFAYLFFTISLFFVLFILKKISNFRSFFYVAAFTLSITLIGELVKRLLK